MKNIAFSRFIINLIIPLELSILWVFFKNSYWEQIIGFYLLSIFVYGLFTIYKHLHEIKNIVPSTILGIVTITGVLSLLTRNLIGEIFTDASLITLFTYISMIFCFTTASTDIFSQNQIIRFIKTFFTYYIPDLLTGMYHFYTSVFNIQDENSIFNLKSLFRKFTYFIIIVPILLLVSFLLSSTNSEFSSFINNITTWINFTNIFIFTTSFIISSFFAAGTAQYINKTLLGNSASIESTIIDTPLFVTNILTIGLMSLNIVYLIYTYFEVSCNLKGLRECVILIKGSGSYSQGTWDAFIALTIVIVINFLLNYFIFGKLIDKTKHFALQKTSMVISILMTIILVFSSTSRLYLYIQGYGFTIFRFDLAIFYVITFISCIIAIFAIIKSSRKIINWVFALYFLAAMLMLTLPVTYIIPYTNFFLYNSGLIQNFDPVYPFQIIDIGYNHAKYFNTGSTFDGLCNIENFKETLKSKDTALELEYKKQIEYFFGNNLPLHPGTPYSDICNQ